MAEENSQMGLRSWFSSWKDYPAGVADPLITGLTESLKAKNLSWLQGKGGTVTEDWRDRSMRRTWKEVSRA